MAPGGAARARSTLLVVGRGTRDARRAARGESPTTRVAQLAPGQVAAQLDAATVLVLPSRSEGLGRVLIEAFCRGRGVVGEPRRRHPRPRRRRRAAASSSTPRTRTRWRTRSSVSCPTARWRSGSAPPRTRASPELDQTPEQFAERVRALRRRPSYTRTRVRADELKQLLKNGVYRSLGEAATGVGAVNGPTSARSARAHVPQGQRRRRQPGHGAAGRVRRADGAARRARLHRRLPRRRARPLRRAHAAAAARRADHLRRRLPRQPRARRPHPGAPRLSGGAVRARSATSAARGRCHTTSALRPAASST